MRSAAWIATGLALVAWVLGVSAGCYAALAVIHPPCCAAHPLAPGLGAAFIIFPTAMLTGTIIFALTAIGWGRARTALISSAVSLAPAPFFVIVAVLSGPGPV